MPEPAATPVTARARRHPDAAAAAQALAGRGFAVFPLRRGGKEPAVRADWEGAATRDPAAVSALFRSARSNIGIACGPSRLLVIDLDVAKPDAAASGAGPRHGAESLRALALAAGREIPPTFTVATPSGGLHLYFRRPEDIELRNTAGRLGPLIDTRARGGYVVAPGSSIGGKAYTIVADRPIAALPGWLIRELAKPDPGSFTPRRDEAHPAAGRARTAYAAAALRGEVDRVRSARPGTRNDTLNRAAYSLGQLVGAGLLDHDEVLGALQDAARRADLPPREAAATIRSGLTAGSHRPRRIAAPERGFPAGPPRRTDPHGPDRPEADPRTISPRTADPHGIDLRGADPQHAPGRPPVAAETPAAAALPVPRSVPAAPAATAVPPVSPAARLAAIADQRAWSRILARHSALRAPIGTLRHELARYESAAVPGATGLDGREQLSVGEIITTLRTIDAAYDSLAVYAAPLSRVPAWRRVRALTDALRDLRDEIENGAPDYSRGLDREVRFRTALRGLLAEACLRAARLAAAIDADHPGFCPPDSPIRRALADLHRAFDSAARAFQGETAACAA
jgi:Bifunctional DNA primase/polymerase, N-terminal